MELQGALGYENMRYEEAYTGGQFGGVLKSISPPKGWRPPPPLISGGRSGIFLPPDRIDVDLSAKRHPFEMKFRLGADRQGKLTALTMDYVVDNGPYTSAGRAMVFGRALYMLSGAYYIPAVKGLRQAGLHEQPLGFCGPGRGPPQANFALESAMDMLAEKIGSRSPGIPPVELP